MGVWIILDTKFVALLLLIAAFALFYAYMALAKGGMKIKARTFPAVAAIPEAIGRAAEMGRPVYYSTGMGQGTLNNQLNGPQTLAGISILGYTTRLCAKSGVKITSRRSPTRFLSSRRRCGQPTWLRVNPRSSTQPSRSTSRTSNPPTSQPPSVG